MAATKISDLTSSTVTSADEIPISRSGSNYKLSLQTAVKTTSPQFLIIAVSDETTNLTTGTAKVTFRMPFAFTLTDVRANVNTAPTGSTIIVDINAGGSTIMNTTKLSIDAGEKTSTTAASAYALTTTTLSDDDEITIDIDQIGSTIAGKGLKVTLIGYKT